MQTGKINVQTENIFPIIKKFLYSDHEIFLRELVSNAVDATKKLQALASMGEFKGEIGDTQIEVSINKDAKTITIKDRGLGMTEEEVGKYINQIAFSGAEEFVNKYKDKTEANLIGHFGLGFYSAFMVAQKVELHTLSFREGAKPVKWECDGSPDFSLTSTNKTERGTEIILHVAEDSLDFLESFKIKGLLEKYCKFLPVEIKFEDKVINNPAPAWTKKPADLTDEDYKKFYNELYPFAEEPLFNIHLNVDYPFNLTGILYFPRLKKTFEVQKNKIQLYCNQVFVTDSVEGIVPDFLTLLQGVLDSPDIPLNVSRSYLQSDGNVKKISAHITKKVADKLEELFKKDREDFEKKFEDIRIFIEYGMISEEKFYEKATKFYLFKSAEGKNYTIDEYKEKIKTLQTDKDKKEIILYASNEKEQHSFIETAKERGYDVLIMDTPLSTHLIGHLEGKLENVSFTRIDADTIDKLINKGEENPSKLSDEQKDSLKPIIEGQAGGTEYTVVFENLSEKDQPVMITRPEWMRRMKDMSALGGGGNMFMGNMPDSYNLVVNVNHPLFGRIINEANEDSKKTLAKQAIDLAKLSQNLLKGEELTKFIKRSIELIN